MKGNKVFYRNALATAIVMAFSAPTLAAGSLSSNNTNNDVLLSGKSQTINGNNEYILKNNKVTAASDSAATAVEINTDKKVILEGMDINAESSLSAYGIKLSNTGNHDVTLKNSSVKAQGKQGITNSSTAIYAVSRTANSSTQYTDNVSLINSKILSGNIESGAVVQNTSGNANMVTGMHTLNLNLSDNSQLGTAGKKILIMSSAGNDTYKGNATTAKDTLNIKATDSVIYADIRTTPSNNKVYCVDCSTTVDMSLNHSGLYGNIIAGGTGASDISLVLDKGSSWSGDVTGVARKVDISLNNNSVWSGTAETTLPVITSRSVPVAQGISISVSGGAVWNVARTSNISDLSVNSGTVNITKATVNTNTFTSRNGTLVVDAGTNNALNVSGKATGDLKVLNTGTVDLKDTSVAFITTGAGSDLKATGTTESGLYEYELMPGADGKFYFVKNTRQTSNASSVIQAMAAAPANVANLQADTLSARQDAVRLSENDKGGVWIQYFGGKQKHTTAGNASYDLDVNGVMLGGDTRFMTEDGSWLAGVAMSSAKGDMTTMQSKGDTEGYSFHAYLSRQYNNGIFIDTAAQF
ncbi:TPA: autotransporter outer membrane beta-barrel domain-containing protein, partial [Escherichia coli]|nr:autotransporter outer membrane beta-barrel domain-containing protein [Escherichia coli]